jgi:hypothetical protein
MGSTPTPCSENPDFESRFAARVSCTPWESDGTTRYKDMIASFHVISNLSFMSFVPPHVIKTKQLLKHN